jgi:hypothetical protein
MAAADFTIRIYVPDGDPEKPMQDTVRPTNGSALAP